MIDITREIIEAKLEITINALLSAKLWKKPPFINKYLHNPCNC